MNYAGLMGVVYAFVNLRNDVHQIRLSLLIYQLKIVFSIFSKCVQ